MPQPAPNAPTRCICPSCGAVVRPVLLPLPGGFLERPAGELSPPEPQTPPADLPGGFWECPKCEIGALAAEWRAAVAPTPDPDVGRAETAVDRLLSEIGGD